MDKVMKNKGGCLISSINYLDMLREAKINLIIDTPYPSEQHECSKALDAVKAITEGEVLEVTVDAFPPAKFDENLPVIKTY